MDSLTNINLNSVNNASKNPLDKNIESNLIRNLIEDFILTAEKDFLTHLAPLAETSRQLRQLDATNPVQSVKIMREYYKQYPPKMNLRLIATGGEVLVNSTLFQMSCPKFGALMASRKDATTGFVNLEGFLSLKELMAVCKFIQTGEIPKITIQNLKDIVETAKTADDLGMQELLGACDKAITDHFSELLLPIQGQGSFSEIRNLLPSRLGRLSDKALIARNLSPYTDMLRIIGKKMFALPLPKLHNFLAQLCNNPDLKEISKEILSNLTPISSVYKIILNPQNPSSPLLNKDSATNLNLEPQIFALQRSDHTEESLELEQTRFQDLAKKLRRESSLRIYACCAKECGYDPKAFFRFFLFLAVKSSTNQDYRTLLSPVFEALVEAYSNKLLDAKEAGWLQKVASGFSEIRDSSEVDNLRFIVPADSRRSHLSINHYTSLCLVLKSPYFEALLQPNAFKIEKEVTFDLITYQDLETAIRIVTSDSEDWLALEEPNHRTMIKLIEFFQLDFFLPKYIKACRADSNILALATEYEMPHVQRTIIESLAESITDVSDASVTKDSPTMIFSSIDDKQLKMNLTGKEVPASAELDMKLSRLSPFIQKAVIVAANKFTTTEKVQLISKNMIEFIDGAAVDVANMLKDFSNDFVYYTLVGKISAVTGIGSLLAGGSYLAYSDPWTYIAKVPFILSSIAVTCCVLSSFFYSCERLEVKSTTPLKLLDRIEVVSSKGNLLVVDMSQCKRTTDEDLRTLVMKHPQITSLKLTPSSRLTKAGWECLGQLKNLKVLKINTVRYDLGELSGLNLTWLKEKVPGFGKVQISLSLKDLYPKTDLTFFDNCSDKINIELKLEEYFASKTFLGYFKSKNGTLDQILKRCPHVTSFDYKGGNVYGPAIRPGQICPDDLRKLGEYCGKTLKSFSYEHRNTWGTVFTEEFSNSIVSIIESCKNLTSVELHYMSSDFEAVSVCEAIAQHGCKIQKVSMNARDNNEGLLNLSLSMLAKSESINEVLIQKKSSAFSQNYRTDCDVSSGVRALLDRKPNAVENILIGAATVSVDLFKRLRDQSIKKSSQSPEIQEFLRYRSLASYDQERVIIPDKKNPIKDSKNSHHFAIQLVLDSIMQNGGVLSKSMTGFAKLVESSGLEVGRKFAGLLNNLVQVLGFPEQDSIKMDSALLQCICRLYPASSVDEQSIWKKDPSKKLLKSFSWWDLQIQDYKKSIKELDIIRTEVVDKIESYVHISKLPRLTRSKLEEFYKFNHAAIRQWFTDNKTQLEGVAWGIYSKTAQENGWHRIHGLWEEPRGDVVGEPHIIAIMDRLYSPLGYILRDLIDEISKQEHLLPDEKMLLLITALGGSCEQFYRSWAALLDPSLDDVGDEGEAEGLAPSRIASSATTQLQSNAISVNDDSNLNLESDEKRDDDDI